MGLCYSTSKGVQEDILFVPAEVGWRSDNLSSEAHGPDSPFPLYQGPQCIMDSQALKGKPNWSWLPRLQTSAAPESDAPQLPH